MVVPFVHDSFFIVINILVTFLLLLLIVFFELITKIPRNEDILRLKLFFSLFHGPNVNEDLASRPCYSNDFFDGLHSQLVGAEVVDHCYRNNVI